MVKRSSWTPAGLLTAWGMVESSRPIENAIGTKTVGGPADPSPAERQAHDYVRKTPGYATAKPILVHHYVKCKPLETMPYIRPGEGLIPALIHHGWMEFYDRPWREIPMTVHGWFVELLTERLVAEPFFVLPPPVDIEAIKDAAARQREMEDMQDENARDRNWRK